MIIGFKIKREIRIKTSIVNFELIFKNGKTNPADTLSRSIIRFLINLFEELLL